MTSMRSFQPVTLPRRTENPKADEICLSVYSRLLQFHKEIKIKDEQFDMNLAREEKEMRDVMEKRQQKQKALIEQYELAMRNDYHWNELLENMSKLSTRHSENYNFKELIHIYFSKAVHQLHQSQQSNHRLTILISFLEDITTKEHSFPYQYLQEIQSVMNIFVNSLDKANEIANSIPFRKLLRNFEEMIYNIINLEKNCLDILKKQESFFPAIENMNDTVQKINLLKAQKLEIEQFQQKFTDSPLLNFLSADIFTVVNNFVLEISEKLEIEAIQSKEQSNQQFIVKKYFPFILLNKQSLQALQQIKDSNKKLQNTLSSNIIDHIQQINSILLSVEEILNNELKIPENPQHLMNTTTEFIVNHIVLRLSNNMIAAIQKSNQCINILFTEMIQVIFQVISSLTASTKPKTKNDIIVIYSMIIYGIFLELKNNSLQKQFSKILLLQFAQFDVVVPNFLFSTNSYSPAQKERNENLIIFFSSLLLYSNDNNNDQYQNIHSDGNNKGDSKSSLLGPLPSSYGLQYLMNSIQQLYFLFFDSTSLPTRSTADSYKIQNLLKNNYPEHEIFSYLYLFMKYSNAVYLLKYQKKYEQFLQKLIHLLKSRDQHPMEKHAPKVKEIPLIEQLIQSQLSQEKVAVPPYYHMQSSYTIHGYLVVSKMKDFSAQIHELEKDKQSTFMKFVEKYEIHRLRMIFNRLGASPESHTTAFNALLEKILLVSQLNTKEKTGSMDLPSESEKSLLIRYLFYKIVLNVFKDSQEQFFNHLDEAQVARLARITCLLCNEISEFISIFQSFYYVHAPLLIPKLVPELSTFQSDGQSEQPNSADRTRERMWLSLGYTRKLKRDSQTDYLYENDEDWMKRMSKVVSVFALTSVQPEQIPGFTITDIWKYLIRLTNECCNLGSMVQRMDYVLMIYDIVLKVCSPFLYQKFQLPFMKLLTFIQKKIFVQFPENHPKKILLDDFINTFLSSNGTNSITLFVETKN